jgi:hypothetical protein
MEESKQPTQMEMFYFVYYDIIEFLINTLPEDDIEMITVDMLFVDNLGDNAASIEYEASTIEDLDAIQLPYDREYDEIDFIIEIYSDVADTILDVLDDEFPHLQWFGPQSLRYLHGNFDLIITGFD